MNALPTEGEGGTVERDMHGKTVLVTGANSGIGKAAAIGFAARGSTLILACRDRERALAARDDIRRGSGSDAVDVAELDLSDLRSVQRCAAEVRSRAGHLDVLVCNAGSTFRTRTLAPAGVEATFAANYLGHYALTRLLLPELAARHGARVISVSSDGHKAARAVRWDDLSFTRRYSALAAYANAKLAQVLFTGELARRCGPALAAYAVHPGFTRSRLYDRGERGPFYLAVRGIAHVFARPPEEAARTIIHLGCTDDPARVNGGYFANCKPHRPSRAAASASAAARLWDLSEQLVKDDGLDLPPA